MLQWLDQFDVVLFVLLNQTLANALFDIIMPFITNKKNFQIPVLLIWLGLVVFGGKKGRISAGLILLVILLSDQLSSSVVKPWVGRLRPCNVLENVRLMVNCTKAFSFTSSHAANMFAAAFLFSSYFPKARIYLYLFAAAIGYSRVYVGVHYPFDVAGGALLGILCAWVVVATYRLITTRYFPKLQA